jgi:hypothetical protein
MTPVPQQMVEEAAPLTVPTPGKGKHACIMLDDDEVSFDEDEPQQKQLRWLPSAGPSSAALDKAAVANKEATYMRATKEATTKRGTEEATVKAAADEEVTGKTADEATGAVGESPAPS